MYVPADIPSPANPTDVIRHTESNKNVIASSSSINKTKHLVMFYVLFLFRRKTKTKDLEYVSELLITFSST